MNNCLQIKISLFQTFLRESAYLGSTKAWFIVLKTMDQNIFKFPCVASTLLHYHHPSLSCPYLHPSHALPTHFSSPFLPSCPSYTKSYEIHFIWTFNLTNTVMNTKTAYIYRSTQNRIFFPVRERDATHVTPCIQKRWSTIIAWTHVSSCVFHLKAVVCSHKNIRI